MRTHTVDHPLAAALLTVLRDERTPNSAFRSALRDLTGLLVYEALRDAPLTRFDINTPITVTQGARVANPPRLVAGQGAGRGIVVSASAQITPARVGLVGQ
ncbi:uracil phosphoribosyltransferase, partial [Nocardia cyriacigeorgica]|uniref:uracil phosphoribosyltransferase n=1 Tax=Nocardia cyriacigeorgica TaxID=135487 RepID=UPI002455452A